ncbi:MAG: NADH-quinone oxidoreductase subunit L [Candidatus Poseidoniaceae archaeon]|jgi:NADH-quinone oxidoreductase subunit L|nr:NADH-quinone oxidoreductase subunit L [Candidatus Poseidoniaceae archaeon]
MSGSGIIEYAVLIPLMPILAFPVILFLGKMFNGTPSWVKNVKEGGLIALTVMGAVLILSILLIKENLHHGSADHIFNWLTSSWWDSDTGAIQKKVFGVGIYIDHLTVMLLFVASFLCFLINVFSIGYMNTDPINDNRNHRFYAEFVLFCSGMLGMVLADSFLWLFIFWEIMGLCSYLLIGFYYERPSAAYAAKKAFLTTRVGDVFLVIGLVMLWNLFDGHLDYSYVFNPENIQAVDQGALQIALGMMFVGAVGKSAQFPLHVWLPDAMEGPTPVSALIHAATMVNAGLYLVARMFPFFAEAELGALSDVAIIIAIIGGITAVMAALIAFVQMDLKKVLAYSTMSQLAYIFTGLGSALWLANNGYDDLAKFAMGASLFHLFNHAMAKGMLFMASGSVIHEMHHAHHEVAHHDDHDDDHFDAQSMENMGGLASRMPITATAMLVGSMSIIGIPFIGGFWSKEGIISSAWQVALKEPIFIFPALLILIGAGMTGFYMSRMWFMTFAGKPKTEVAEHVHEQTPWIPIPLVTLTFMTLFAIVLAFMHSGHWLGDFDNGHYTSDLVHGAADEMHHVFANDDPFLLLLTYVAIGLSLVLGPSLAMALYGGRLDEGQKAKPWIQWAINLSSKVRRSSHFDNSAWAESSFAKSLHKRLHFDDWYDAAMMKIVVGFANLSALFDSKIIDGAIKGIESSSQGASRKIRLLTTGSARDYIMMAALGTLAIFLMLWGVA